MTLALYGKSRKRQGLLGLLAVLAVALAVVLTAAGVAQVARATTGPVSGAGVHPVPLGGNPKCTDLDNTYAGGQTWSEFKIDELPENGVYSDGALQVTISNAGLVNGHYLFDWSANFGVDAVFVKQANTASNLYVYDPPGPERTSDTGLGPQPGQNQGGISHVSFCYDPDPEPDEATIWIKKVQEGGPENTTFTADVFRGTSTTPEHGGIQFSESPTPGPQAVTITDPAGDDFTVSEQNPGAEWVVSWAVLAGNASCDTVQSWTAGSTAFGSFLNDLDPDEVVTVCFRNEFQQAQDKGSITVCKIIKDESGTIVDGSEVPGAQFSVTVRHDGDPIGTATFTAPIAQDDLGNGLKGECQLVAANLDKDNGYTYDEEVYPQDGAWLAPQYSDINATSFCTFNTNDNDCDGHIPITNNRLHRTVYVQNQYQTGDLVIRKVIVGEGGDPADQFSGNVTGPYGFDEAFTGLSENSDVEHDGVPVGTYTVSEDDPAALGYALLGYSVHEDPDDAFECPGAPGAGPASATVSASETTVVCVYNAVASEPTMSKAASGFDTTTGRASWVISVFNNVQNAIPQTIQIFDEGVRVDDVTGGSCAGVVEETTVIGAGGISCDVAAGDILQVTVSVEHAQACEPGSVSNEATVELDGQPLAGPTTDTVEVPGDDDLCPSTVTVQKFFDTDDSNTITAGDTLVNGWGMSIVCTADDSTEVLNTSGSTGANGQGTVVFTIPQGPYPVTCTVTEGTLLLVETVIGPVLETTLDQPGSALVQFLNDPTELPPPPPPGNEGPVPQGNPQIPQPTEEPQEPEPTATPVEPTREPQEPEPTETPGAEATPAAPKAGSGTAAGGTRSAGSLWLAAVGLLAVSGAAGTLALARRRR